jgi:hypothetical protein
MNRSKTEFIVHLLATRDDLTHAEIAEATGSTRAFADRVSHLLNVVRRVDRERNAAPPDRWLYNNSVPSQVNYVDRTTC